MKLPEFKISMLFAVLSVICLCSCSDEVQSAAETAAPEDVPAAIHADFTRSYPDASDVAWSVSDGYAMASFISNTVTAESGHHSSVWYLLNDNQKKMHSAPVLFADLPTAVISAFRDSEYAALTPSEPAHVITRYLDGNTDYIYVIKATGALEGTAATAVKLYYTLEGKLVKLSSEIIYDESFADKDDFNEFQEWLPQTPADFVKAYVDACYPDSRYLYIYEGQNFTKVKILDRHTVRTLLFDAGGAWTSTATEIDRDDIPAEILATFRTSEFAQWHISKITEFDTASDGHYYLLSLEKDKNKAELRIEANGSVTEEPSTPSEPVAPGDTPAGTPTYLAKSELKEFILAKYPGASVVKYDYDDDEAEVEITYDGHKIKVEFERHTQGYLWSQSEWDFDVRNTASLPASILKTLSDKYSGYRLEYLVYTETATSAPVYEAGLKSPQTKRTVKVKMDEQGNIIAEYDKH